MPFSIKAWFRISIVSFLFVALVGVLMRYKIAFSLPVFDQKHLLHAHSHFAFTGWISQTLYLLLIYAISGFHNSVNLKKYRFILLANILCSYGMLVFFTLQGYGPVSITFSTLSILINYLFAFWFYKDLKKIGNHPAKSWFNASLFFSVISSFGTFYLAYMMYSQSVQQNQYLGSLYFFLHFQYNGWFFFAAMGLVALWLNKNIASLKLNPLVYKLFFWACAPAYFLSTLWADLPVWLYVLIVISAVIQVIAWIIFVLQIKDNYKVIKEQLSPVIRFVLFLVGVAFSIKLLLQLGSTIPSVSKLAFGFRPVVIAYLHLILLAVFTLFLLSYAYANGFLNKNKLTIYGLLTIVAGVFLNEFILLVQGVTGFIYMPVPYVSEILLGAALIIFSGILLLLSSQSIKEKIPATIV